MLHPGCFPRKSFPELVLQGFGLLSGGSAKALSGVRCKNSFFRALLPFLQSGFLPFTPALFWGILFKEVVGFV